MQRRVPAEIKPINNEHAFYLHNSLTWSPY